MIQIIDPKNMAIKRMKFQWTHRKGDVIYANLANDDPNRDKRLRQMKYEKTTVRNDPSHNQ
jgi:hypothetical protein